MGRFQYRTMKSFQVVQLKKLVVMCFSFFLVHVYRKLIPRFNELVEEYSILECMECNRGKKPFPPFGKWVPKSAGG